MLMKRAIWNKKKKSNNVNVELENLRNKLKSHENTWTDIIWSNNEALFLCHNLQTAQINQAHNKILHPFDQFFPFLNVGSPK
jgi:hypothetical protein